MSDQDNSKGRPDPKELVAGFVHDVINDSRDYNVKFESSSNQKELVKMGKEVLPTIVQHLKNNPPDSIPHLATAWGNLLLLIQQDINPAAKAPTLLKDTAGWIAWAKSVST